MSRTLSTLTTEAANPAWAEIDTWPTGRLVTGMIDADRGLYDAVASCEDAITAAVDGIVERMSRGGRLIYMGAGTAGRLGVLDASEIPPTFGTDPSLVVGVIAGGSTAVTQAVENAEDDLEAGAQAMVDLDVGETDTLVGIAGSGRTPYVLGGLAEASRRGAMTIGLTNNAGSAVGDASDIAIEVVVGPEFIAGSTRLRSGTSQKLVLNLLSTLTMVKLGKTYGNLMVDLRATNEKLRVRAVRTVVAATGASEAEAAAAVQGAEGSVKTAILMVLAGVDAADARTRLSAVNGHLRDALIT
ncbi:MAG: N-acetylmuramic acid 6-phosphate etherase [Propionibacteriaceae bacterium]